MSNSSEELTTGGGEAVSELDERFGAITHSFYVQMPLDIGKGQFNPEYIQRSWVGINIPVRRQLQDWPEHYQDGETEGVSHSELNVRILVEDAVVTLIENDKQDAANFWGNRYSPDSTLLFAGYNGLIMGRELSQKEKSDFLKRSAGKFGMSEHILFVPDDET